MLAIHDFNAPPLVISTAAPVARTPRVFSSATALMTWSAFRAQTATSEPSPASVPAIARPMPRVPPSTTAFFPLKPKSICIPSVARAHCSGSGGFKKIFHPHFRVFSGMPVWCRKPETGYLANQVICLYCHRFRWGEINENPSCSPCRGSGACASAQHGLGRSASQVDALPTVRRRISDRISRYAHGQTRYLTEPRRSGTPPRSEFKFRRPLIFGGADDLCVGVRPGSRARSFRQRLHQARQSACAEAVESRPRPRAPPGDRNGSERRSSRRDDVGGDGWHPGLSRVMHLRKRERAFGERRAFHQFLHAAAVMMLCMHLVRLGLRVLHLDHALAAVLAGEQSDQGLRRVLKAIDNVFLDFDLAGGDP